MSRHHPALSTRRPRPNAPRLCAWRRLGMAVAISQIFAASVLAADLSWSTPGTGFWDDAANWSGAALPTEADNVTIDLGAATATIRQLPGAPANPLTRYAVGSLIAKSAVEHAGGSLLVKGDATFEGAFTWSGGVLHVDPTTASGTWTFRKGIHLTATDLVGMNAGRAEWQGTSVFEDRVRALLGPVAVHLAAGATLDIRAATGFVSTGEWVIDGTIDRSTGAGTFQLFLGGGGNQGVVRNRSGVLELLPTGFDGLAHAGTFAVDTGAELRFVGAHTFRNTISGAGNVTFSQFNDFTVDASRFELDGTLTLENGAKGVWQGNGTIKRLRFAGANFQPEGEVDIVDKGRIDGLAIVIGGPGSRTRFLAGLDLKANFIAASGAVELGGQTTLQGDVGLGVGNGGTLTVAPGATLRLANDATATGAGAIVGPGRFVNRGLVQRDTATGEFRFSVAEFVNAGRLALKSGHASAAVDFEQTADGTLAIELGSVTGAFAVGGAAGLDGVLEIGFARGFVPTLGQTFELLTYGTHSGAFTARAVGEAARSGYTFALSYGEHALDLTVTGLAPAVPEPQTYALFGVGLLLMLGLRRRSMR